MPASTLTVADLDAVLTRLSIELDKCRRTGLPIMADTVRTRIDFNLDRRSRLTREGRWPPAAK